MSVGIIPLLVLLVVAVIAIPVLVVVVRSAGARNQNRAESEKDWARKERESGEQNR